jgi:hypothetical protein
MVTALITLKCREIVTESRALIVAMAQVVGTVHPASVAPGPLTVRAPQGLLRMVLRILLRIILKTCLKGMVKLATSPQFKMLAEST